MPGLGELCDELERGAGAVLLPEEALASGDVGTLERWLDRQPPWSDLPLIVFVRRGEETAGVAQAMDARWNITLLEWPARVAALLSVVRSALRARRRQYQIRDELERRERQQQAQALLAAIVESSDDAIISHTLQGRILSWNVGAERLYGYPAAEAIGSSITMLLPADRPDEQRELLDRVRRGEGVARHETVRVRRDGSRVEVSLTVSPVHHTEGRIIAASKMARDITAAKRAARDLRATRQQLQLVTDHMAAVVFHCGSDLRYRWASPSSAGFLGRPTDEIVGRSIEEVIGTPDFDVIRPYVARALAGERVDFEMRLPYRQLGWRWVKAVYVPTRDAMGRPDGWVAVITDTTAHRELEQALRNADRRKDDFLAVLAHELRNPLAPIRNCVEILRPLSDERPEVAPVLEMLDRQVRHMVRLVDDLLEVSRITRGKIVLRRELVDAATTVRSAVEESRVLCEAAGHVLELEVPPEPLVLEGDPVRLAQVFVKLLGNAAKYTEPGGRITVKVERLDDEAVIAVRDTGIGIPPDEISRVFEPFTQVDREIGGAHGGLGIGLTLVKTLIELHQGSVRAFSEWRGKGSEFVVRLPLAEPSAAPTSPSRPEAAPARATLPPRVLVVDDNHDAARTLATLLELRGGRARAAFSGEEALAVLDDFRPDVVLLDIGMPGMDGFEVARRIRQRPELRRTTLVALTGWGQKGDRLRSRNAGFDHHLTKPADLDALTALLAKVQADRDG